VAGSRGSRLRARRRGAAGGGLDAVVVGSGPNGLAAAVTLARAGLGVTVLEGAPVPGGGCRTAELTLPGFRHDVCAAVHPLAAASPFLRTAGPDRGGLGLLTPEVAFAHPLDGGQAVALRGSVARTAAGLGADAATYARLLGPLVRDTDAILETFLGPLRSVPSRPAAAARFAAAGLPPATLLAQAAAHPGRTGPAGRRGRALHATARHAADRRLRVAADNARAPRRLAGSAGRQRRYS